MNQSHIFFDLQAELCQALGHSIRLQILHLLKENPLRVKSISEQLGMPQALISRHLAILRNVGVVVAERHGQDMVYAIANPKIVGVCEMMRAVLAEREVRRSEMLGTLEE
jgi:DNA-binding transcriptional ArsR family regulator